MLPVIDVANSQFIRRSLGEERLVLDIGIGNILTLATFIIGLFFGTSAIAQPTYTNHAGNVIAGWPVSLTATHVTLAERISDS